MKSVGSTKLQPDRRGEFWSHLYNRVTIVNNNEMHRYRCLKGENRRC